MTRGKTALTAATDCAECEVVACVWFIESRNARVAAQHRSSSILAAVHSTMRRPLHLLLGLIAAAHGFSSPGFIHPHSNIATRSLIIDMMATCRICLESFDPLTNNDKACCHHPGALRGESARKGNWEGDRGPDSGTGGELVYTYTCCGKEKGSPGCTYSRCVGFGE